MFVPRFPPSSPERLSRAKPKEVRLRSDLGRFYSIRSTSRTRKRASLALGIDDLKDLKDITPSSGRIQLVIVHPPIAYGGDEVLSFDLSLDDEQLAFSVSCGWFSTPNLSRPGSGRDMDKEKRY